MYIIIRSKHDLYRLWAGYKYEFANGNLDVMYVHV